MNREFIEAIEQLEKEKHVSKDMLLDTIESALVSAYKKNYGTSQNVRVVINRETGDIAVLMRKDIVADEDLEDIMLQMTLDEAHEIDHRYEIGDAIEFAVTPADFGRIAAQTAKQVVVQRIREAERNMIFDEFIDRQGEIVTGTVQRKSGNTMFVNVGRAEGILPGNEQVFGEFFRVHDRLKVYIMDVKKTNKGPQVFLSRTHPGLVKMLFELEVPEIQDGVVEIRGIAREAGSRTKMAVYSSDENVDPVGACVGTRGTRVQNVVDELHGEKIDIISWSEDPYELIANVLSPSEVEEVIIENADEKIATAVVPDYQLSLAIGKQGQNVRLAAKVSGWKIDIKSRTQYEEALDAGLYDVETADDNNDFYEGKEVTEMTQNNNEKMNVNVENKEYDSYLGNDQYKKESTTEKYEELHSEMANTEVVGDEMNQEKKVREDDIVCGQISEYTVDGSEGMCEIGDPTDFVKKPGHDETAEDKEKYAQAPGNEKYDSYLGEEQYKKESVTAGYEKLQDKFGNTAAAGEEMAETDNKGNDAVCSIMGEFGGSDVCKVEDDK